MDENLTLVVFGVLFAGMTVICSAFSCLCLAVYLGFQEQKSRTPIDETTVPPKRTDRV